VNRAAIAKPFRRRFGTLLHKRPTMPPFETQTDAGYTPVAKALHWLVVALLFCQYALAWTMPHIGRDTKPDRIINLHFSFGVLILLVLAIRLAWRWTHREPAPPAGLPSWIVHSSRAIHYLGVSFRCSAGSTPRSAGST
jgi:cytochrome b